MFATASQVLLVPVATVVLVLIAVALIVATGLGPIVFLPFSFWLAGNVGGSGGHSDPAVAQQRRSQLSNCIKLVVMVAFLCAAVLGIQSFPDSTEAQATAPLPEANISDADVVSDEAGFIGALKSIGKAIYAVLAEAFWAAMGSVAAEVGTKKGTDSVVRGVLDTKGKLKPGAFDTKAQRLLEAQMAHNETMAMVATALAVLVCQLYKAPFQVRWATGCAVAFAAGIVVMAKAKSQAAVAYLPTQQRDERVRAAMTRAASLGLLDRGLLTDGDRQ